MANILVFGNSIAFGNYDNKGGWVDRLKRNLLNTSPPPHENNKYLYNLAIDTNASSDTLKQLNNDTNPRQWTGKRNNLHFRA